MSDVGEGAGPGGGVISANPMAAWSILLRADDRLLLFGAVYVSKTPRWQVEEKWISG